ncbi:MAG TPA: peptidylprolyl isomerase [Bryobacteraceae bacterium]|nr:peptidylprolyl isomerase [Bryobacteraceae bacterium]
MKAFVLIAILAAAAVAQQIPQLSPAAPQTTLPGNTVVATVSGVSLTIDDIRKMVENAPPAVTRLIQSNGVQEFIQQAFLFRHLADLGDNLKLGEESPLKDQIETERKWIIANAMVTHERNYFQVSEEQINDFYQKNQSRWQQAKIRAIFIGFKAAAPAPADPKDLKEAAKQALESAHPANQRSEEEARKLAADLVMQLRGGADFGKLVEQYSDDSSSKGSGGEFPAIKATSPYPEDLKKAIFALHNGDISDPIRQPTGFYIVRVEEKSVQPLNDVREPIVQEMRDNHLKDWLTDMGKRYTPVIQNPQFFAQPQLYLLPPGSSAPPKQ